MARPVLVSRTRVLPHSAKAIMDEFLRVERWSTFRGYGPVPGIREARILSGGPGSEVGTRIAVTNLDGSTHREEILAWVAPADGRAAHITVRIDGFSPPLARLAERFIEEWELAPDPASGGTRVRRTFALAPKSTLTRFALFVIGGFLGRALGRHLAEFTVGPT